MGKPIRLHCEVDHLLQAHSRTTCQRPNAYLNCKHGKESVVISSHEDLPPAKQPAAVAIQPHHAPPLLSKAAVEDVPFCTCSRDTMLAHCQEQAVWVLTCQCFHQRAAYVLLR